MPPRTRRPSPRRVGPYRLRVVRGPHRDAPARWYWRAEQYRGATAETVWTGWGTVEEADAAVARLVTGESTPGAHDCETVRDLLSLWHGGIEQRGDLAPATIDGYGAGAVRLRDVIGTVALARVDRATIERYRDQALRMGRTARTVQTDLKLLRLAWRWGRETGHAPERDLPRVSVRAPELVHARVTPESVAATVARLEGASRVHLLLLWATGCRVSEIAALRWGDVRETPTRTWIAVTGKRRRREVPLPTTAAAVLRAWGVDQDRRPGAYVLARTPASSRQMFFRHLRAAGAVWTPQDLRRAAVDTLYATGTDPGTAGRILGHSPAVALRHYRRAAEADLEAAVDRAGMGDLPAAVAEALTAGEGVIDLGAERFARTPNPHTNPHNDGNPPRGRR